MVDENMRIVDKIVGKTLFIVKDLTVSSCKVVSKFSEDPNTGERLKLPISDG